MRNAALPTHFGRNGLLQMLLFWMLLIAGLYIIIPQLGQMYQAWTLTPAGLYINGFTIVLFFFGMIRMAALLYEYHREELAIAHFVQVWANKGEIHGSSLIANRYFAMQSLHAQQTPVHQGALAAALMAREKARTATLRYINNVLILCGVFGTIVSLSIALVGASGLLDGAVNAEGMGLVIHGMSSALSTTMTAIACYFFFHYFLTQVENARMTVLASIEHLSTTLLSAAFHIQAEHIPYQMADLIQGLRSTVHSMQKSQDDWQSQQQEAQRVLQQQMLHVEQVLEIKADSVAREKDGSGQQLQLELRLLRVMQELRQQQQEEQRVLLDTMQSIDRKLARGFRLSEQS